MSSNKRGITRGEVIAIIIILMALVGAMYPVVRSSRRTALQSACATNLYNVALAIQAYSHDYAGKVPPAEVNSKKPDYVNPSAFFPGASDEINRHLPGLWFGRLRSYTEPKYFICPVTTPEMKGRYFYAPKLPGSSGKESVDYTTYGMNWRFFNGGDLGGNPLKPVKIYAGVIQPLESPPIPNKTVLLIETQQRMEWTGRGKSPFTSKPQVGGNITPYGDWDNWFWSIRWLDSPVKPNGHMSGCNIILADGHAAFVNAPQSPYPPKVSYIKTLGYRWW